MNAETASESARPAPWRWVAVIAAASLGAIELQRLVTFIRWERALPFARDVLPGAIAAAALALAAYLLILALLLLPRGRKWGLALGIGWGAIVAGSSLWLWLGPYAKNLWYATAFRLHMTNTLRHYQSLGGPTVREAQWVAGLGILLALCAAKAFADSARERLDRGVLLACLFYAAFYDLAVGIVSRLVTPH